MWPNTYHTTGKKPSPPQSRKHPIYEAFDLKVIYQVHRTGFEEHKGRAFPSSPPLLARIRVAICERVCFLKT